MGSPVSFCVFLAADFMDILEFLYFMHGQYRKKSI